MHFADPSARLSVGRPENVPSAIRWEGYLLNGSGYGEEARGYFLELARRGHDLKLLTTQDDPGFPATLPPEDAAVLSAARRRPLSEHDVVVEHLVPYLVARRNVGGYHVARTMFETDGLPAAWIPRLQQMDEIWVPTPFNVETFQRAGVTVPIHVVPAGVDAGLFHPAAAPLDLPGSAGTRFLAVAADITQRRYGIDVLLAAWARAFTTEDDVQLVIKTSKSVSEQLGGRTGIDDWLALHLGSPVTSCAPVLVITDHLATVDVPRLYTACDALIAPLRGTALGRPFLEAMATELLVVGTRWSAIPDFLNEDNGIPLEIDHLTTIGEEEAVDFYRGQQWAEPSVDHLTEVLRTIAADRSGMGRLATRAREDVLTGWTWDAMVDLVEARLADIDARTTRNLRPAGSLRVRWEGDQFQNHSLAVVNRNTCAELVLAEGLDVELSTRECLPISSVIEGVSEEHRKATGHVLPQEPQVTVRQQWPPDWTPPAHGAWVAVQPWEFGAVPLKWMQGLSRVDEVWCYTNWVKDCFELSGVPAEKLHIVPLGVDADRFTPDGPRFPVPTTASRRFLFCGGAIARKGIDVLVNAYRTEFTAADDVCLVIKAHGSATSYAGNNFVQQLRELAATPGAEIVIIDEDLSEEGLASLYRACTALVHPYRGEGFALPVAEAMSCGLPVVVTVGGATADFCDAENAYLVAGEITEVKSVDQGPSSQVYFWIEPDQTSLQHQLRAVATASPEHLAQLGRTGRARILAEYTWRHSAERVRGRLEALAGAQPVRERRAVSTRPAP